VEESDGTTTESRIRYHLVGELKDRRLADLSLKALQAFLNAKAVTYSRSIVAHLRFDLRSIFKLAIAEGHIERDPTRALFTPKQARSPPADH
jgi:site-specific recombinase XerD